MGEDEQGAKVEAIIGKAEEPYVKIYHENGQLKIEHNCPNFAVALGLTLDGLPHIFQLHIDEIKGEKSEIVRPAMVVLKPGVPV